MYYKINFEALRQEGLKPLFEALEREQEIRGNL